jgi:hypothetical protein
VQRRGLTAVQKVKRDRDPAISLRDRPAPAIGRA